MLSCSSNTPLPRAASLPGVLLPTEPVLLPFLGAGTPALRLVQVGGVWGWGKHCWEQDPGKGRCGQHTDEQLLRIPAQLGRAAPQNPSTACAASAGPGWGSKGWAPPKEELEPLKVDGRKVKSQSSQVGGQRTVSPPAALGFQGWAGMKGALWAVPAMPHCSHPQLMFSTSGRGPAL